MGKQRGFTLVEIAMVIVIGALLLGFALSVLTAQLTNTRIKATQNQAYVIKIALVTFLATRNRLPCPAVEGLNSTNAAYGIEAPNPGTCTGTTNLTGASRGVVPWVSLGLADTAVLDGWNRRFTYVVTTSETNLTSINAQVEVSTGPPQARSTVPALTGNLTVHNATPVGGGLPPPVAQNQINACSTGATDNSCNNFAVVILISHGANGTGAFLPGNGVREPLPPGANELENTDTDLAFTQMSFIGNTTAAGGVFDDMVSWIPPADLVTPLVASRTVASVQGAVTKRIDRIEKALLAYIIRDTVDPDGAPVPGGCTCGATCTGGCRTVNRRVPFADTAASVDGVGDGPVPAPGAIPYVDLGLGQQEVFDPWGTRIRYVPGGIGVVANTGVGGIYGSATDTTAYFLTSFGPDGVLGGGDDYSVIRTVPELIGTIAGAGLTVDP